jgi:cobalt-zinc-cadmium efflux system membrane fusion protein
MKQIIMLLFPAIMLCACHGNKQEEKDNTDISLKGNIIEIGAGSPILAHLKTEKVALEPYSVDFTTSGVVKAIPTSYAEIASPFAGRIVRSFVRLGQRVMPGSPIFEISSPEFYETGKIYYQAKQEMELAQKSLKRERDLVDNKVGVKKELEEAEVNYELKKKDYENARASLKVFQINPDRVVLGQPLIIRSPIAGEVVTDQMVIGQYIKEDAAPVAVIANLSKVWFVAHVKEKDLNLIQSLNNVEIRLVAMPDHPFTGKIYHISEMLDEETRSVEVLVECDNSAHLMKPQMYGSVKLSDKATEVIRIPTSAIMQEEDNCYVLISLGNHKYRKQKVTTGTTEGGKTLVLSGLNSGDEIVATGAFYLLDVR